MSAKREFERLPRSTRVRPHSWGTPEPTRRGQMHGPELNESRPQFRPDGDSQLAGRWKLTRADSARDAKLVLIRGLPGSGKSTMARAMAADGFVHLEADMFFTVDGVYTYDAARIREAHHWCQKKTRQELSAGQRVVVSNTFTQLHEMEPYQDMGTEVCVMEASGCWPNTHGVPAEKVEMMKRRWQPLGLV